MSKSIDPCRLKELRTRAGLKRKTLGEKTGINPQTIYRIEAGRPEARSPRRETVEKLAATLGVSPEVLTGEAPLPDTEPTRAGRSNDEDYSINVLVDGAVRNAFTLTAIRYRVPITQIVKLAPFLFVLAAEASLERRISKLGDLEKALNRARELESNFPHLPSSLSPSSYEYIDAERKSISARDIWGDRVPDDIFAGAFAIEENYDRETLNPFVKYLKETVPAEAEADVASIHGFDRSSSSFTGSSCAFTVCWEDALKLADGDVELATSIVEGEVILHKIPRELFNDDAVDARIAWLREKRDAYHAIPVITAADLL